MAKHITNCREVIRNIEIFNDIDDDSMNLLLKSIKEKNIKPNKTIIHHGDSGDGVFILTEGLLGTYLYSKSHYRPVLVNIVKPYGVVGELSEILSINRGVEVTAIRDSKVLKISSHVFQIILNKNPIIYKTLCRQIHQWLMSANEKILQGLLTSENVIYELLLFLEEAPGAPINITHEDISKMVGISRESVSKSIKRLKKNKVLHQGRGKIFLSKEVES